jgi:hypothetical protein
MPLKVFNGWQRAPVHLYKIDLFIAGGSPTMWIGMKHHWKKDGMEQDSLGTGTGVFSPHKEHSQLGCRSSQRIKVAETPSDT